MDKSWKKELPGGIHLKIRYPSLPFLDSNDTNVKLFGHLLQNREWPIEFSNLKFKKEIKKIMEC